MRNRPNGFLAEDKISHESEVFNYIQELHGYLWEFIYLIIPSASGRLNDYVDIALKEGKHKNKNELSRERLNYLLKIMYRNSVEYSINENSYEIRLIPELQQAYDQICKLVNAGRDK